MTKKPNGCTFVEAKRIDGDYGLKARGFITLLASAYQRYVEVEEAKVYGGKIFLKLSNDQLYTVYELRPNGYVTPVAKYYPKRLAEDYGLRIGEVAD